MERCLVTGATGYLGRHLIDSLLADGVPVRALVYREWKGEELERQGVEVLYGDVTDPQSLEGMAQGVDSVFHLVGGGNDGRIDPFLINTQGTRNVLEACRTAGLRAFIYVSTSTLYGRNPNWVNEGTAPEPRFDYPQSKLEAEALLLRAAEEEGFPAMVARMGGLYGPGASMLATDLVRMGRLTITGDGQNQISVLHVDDAVQALRAMLERGKPGRIYCLSDDEPPTIHAFHSYYAGLLGAPPVRTSSVRRVRLIISLARFLSRLVGRRPPLTEAVIELSILNVMMENRRMKEELGVVLKYPTFREGLAQCAAALEAEEEE